jgi:rifampicin phosphotransferase
MALAEPRATEHSVTGGKGANLAKMIAAGFAVPAGFAVTTRAYRTFLSETGLEKEIDRILERLDTSDRDALEATTAEIRGMIIEAEAPKGLTSEISAAYEGLGDAARVAVRSSGTAEDLEGASFAGLHETYLDIHGGEAVLAAVQRCWASLWTARATAYRADKGFDSGTVGIAVVVQEMINAELSGVMFTGNPLNTATDELLINSSWGLGEAIVGGITTPDQYVVKSTDLRIRDQTLGTKEVEIVREPAGGTRTQDVATDRRERFTLADEQVQELAELGRAVAEYYSGLPQDIEWAYAAGEFFVLQSRPITGVEFSWDAEVDASSLGHPRAEDDDYWTRAWVDEAWTGAITPLFYSVRAPSWEISRDTALLLWGEHDLRDIRFFRFYKGEAYSNLRYERLVTEKTMPPPFRKLGVWDHMPVEWMEETLKEPFSYADYLKLYSRLNLVRPQRDRAFGWFAHNKQTYFEGKERGPKYADGASPAKLRKLSDAGLKLYVEQYVRHEDVYNADFWTGCFVYLRDATCLLKLMLDKWYTGENPAVFTDLLSGTNQRTPALEESHTLWRLAQRIRESEVLSAAFAENEAGDFFAACADSDDGREFLADYQEFLQVSGHRGHQDRDTFFPRRSEDPSIDYNALKGYIDLDRDPEDRERETLARRKAAIQDVVENIRPTAFGWAKVEAFRVLMEWWDRFIVVRDTERNFIDRSTFALRRAFLEVGRRLVQRGLVDTEDDVWFVTVEELWPLLAGTTNMPLTRTKIAARKRDHQRFNSREWAPPKYLHGYEPVDLDAPATEDVEGAFRGIGTSSGTVTGTARIVKGLSEIGRVKKHEILLCNATDPGWTAVFNVIDGIVTETGGALSHASCLAREYGLPAAQLPNAMQLIPDGATITVDGGSGRIEIVDTGPASERGDVDGASASPDVKEPEAGVAA